MTKILVKNLSKSFGNNLVLKDISFSIDEGESFVIMGGSGTGKSVLIKAIMGLHLPDEKSFISIDETDVTFIPIAKRRSLMDKVGVLFQNGALFDSLTIWQNVCFKQISTKYLSKAQAKDLAASKLELVGLKPYVLDLYPAELSGGMIKRVALARAISTDPEIIFFDEPTAGLDPITSGAISDLIKACSKKLGATTITITHDMNCANRIADKAALIFKGEFIWQGFGKDLMDSPNEYLQQFVHGKPEGPMSV